MGLRHNDLNQHHHHHLNDDDNHHYSSMPVSLSSSNVAGTQSWRLAGVRLNAQRRFEVQSVHSGIGKASGETVMCSELE